jgi:hypothetical protein
MAELWWGKFKDTQEEELCLKRKRENFFWIHWQEQFSGPSFFYRFPILQLCFFILLFESCSHIYFICISVFILYFLLKHLPFFYSSYIFRPVTVPFDHSPLQIHWFLLNFFTISVTLYHFLLILFVFIFIISFISSSVTTFLPPMLHFYHHQPYKTFVKISVQLKFVNINSCWIQSYQCCVVLYHVS